MKCLFAYNPISGKGKIKKKLDYIVDRLFEKYDEVEVYETKRAGDISLLASNIAQDYDAFIFSGGDGTFNEVVNGLAEKENKPVLGYIPTGTVNDIARSMGIGRKVKKALDVIINGKVEKFDLIKANNAYSFYAIACGAMTTCSYMANQSSKGKLGKFAYLGYILSHDLKFNRFTVELSHDEVVGQTEAVMIMIINSRSVSSFKLNKKAVLNDGKVDVVIIKEKPRRKEWGLFRVIRNFFKTARLFFFGYAHAQKSKCMETFTTSELTLKVDEDMVWNFDGEKGLSGELKISVLQEEISLIIPNKR